MDGVREKVLDHIDQVARYTGTDIFLLNPTAQDEDVVNASFGNGSSMKFDQRLRITIYGDPESSEHAKTRILLLIDQIVSWPLPQISTISTISTISLTLISSFNALSMAYDSNSPSTI